MTGKRFAIWTIERTPAYQEEKDNPTEVWAKTWTDLSHKRKQMVNKHAWLLKAMQIRTSTRNHFTSTRLETLRTLLMPSFGKKVDQRYLHIAIENANEMFCISYDRAIPPIYTLEKFLNVGIMKCNKVFDTAMLTKQWKWMSMDES